MNVSAITLAILCALVFCPLPVARADSSASQPSEITYSINFFAPIFETREGQPTADAAFQANLSEIIGDTDVTLGISNSGYTGPSKDIPTATRKINELNIEASALRAEANAPEAEGGLAHLEGDELTAAEEASREMRQKLEAMGPVNMMALDEYKETAERHAFLETQRKDLVDSIENTQSTIKEIDQISRVKFDEAFAKINENFGHVFTKLFHGGQAFLRLTDAENQAESGLEIVASPPGKKLQNVLLLSGGEKALTALSLLVGIFQYQPAPFCVLDEVDAALDETNVGRLADLLHGMSQDTQFLLVTHSKRMMQTADMIYGVTMQEPGVSKIVSVHLGHQQQDRGRERATA